MEKGLSVSVAELIAEARSVQRLSAITETAALGPGGHRSRLRGRGMDFSEARNYQSGDDIRHMEWRVTARTGRPHVKVYQEERERPIFLLVDFNASMYFGTRIAFKSVIAARLAAILAWLAAKQGDRVGGLVYTACTHQEFTPRTRQAGVLAFLAGLSHYSAQYHLPQNDSHKAFNNVLTRAQRLVKPGSLIVLISDFYHLNQQSERLLSRLHSHNDIVAYHICDPLELSPPLPGRYGMSDGQTDVLLDTTRDTQCIAYQCYSDQRIMALRTQMQRLHIPYSQVTPYTHLATVVQQTFPARRRG